MSSIRATVTASSYATRILVQDPIGDLLIARLDPVDHAQRYALRMLLEATALWQQQRIDVVLCADDRCEWRHTGLLDALEVARETALLRVQFAPVHSHPVRRVYRLTGLGSFARERADLRTVRV